MENQSVTQVVLNTQKNTEDPFLTKARLLKIEDSTEREREIACWACEFGFEEIRPVSMPICPVSLYEARRDVRAKRLQGKRVRIKQETLEKPEVVTYFDVKWTTEKNNISNFEWLKRLKKMLDYRRDEKHIVQINERLKVFKNFFEKQEEPFYALKGAY